MKESLKNFYTNCLLKLSMLATGILNKIMLHAIKIQGLDPNSNPELNARKRFQEELNAVFGPCGTASKTIKFPIKSFKKFVPTSEAAYVNKIVVPPGSVSDFSDVGSGYKPPTTSELANELANELLKKYSPAYTVVESKTDSFLEMDSVAKNLIDLTSKKDIITKEDQKIINELDRLTTSVERTLASKKKTAKTARPVKAIKKLAKKNRKK